PTQADFVVRNLAIYPITSSAVEYYLIRKISKNNLIRCLNYLQVPHLQLIFLSLEGYIFTLSRRYLPPQPPHHQQIQSRYTELVALPLEIKELLRLLYHTSQ